MTRAGIVLKALFAGAGYGAAYLGAELLGVVVLFEWLGVGSSILGEIRAELLRLLAIYLVGGATLALLLCPVVAAIEARLGERWRGPGVTFLALALVCVVLAHTVLPRSLLPTATYDAFAFAAHLVILGAAALGLALQRILRWTGWKVPLGLLAALAIFSLLGSDERAAGPTLTAPEGAERRNLLLVVIDTLRRDHVGAYGYQRPTTPVLDRLAREGATFERAFTTASWTLPAHASLFTGVATATHGADVATLRLDERLPTLAERLRDAGYRTGGFSANPWLSRASGLDRGFETFDYLGVETTTGALFGNLLVEVIARFVPALRRDDLGGARVTAGAVDWLEAGEGEPFFAFLNYMEAHEPYGSVPEPFFSSFLEDELPRDVGREWVRHAGHFLCTSCEPKAAPAGLHCEGDRWRAKADRVADATSLYDAGVLYADAQLGAVLDALERAGVLDQTLVVVTSDHGEALGEEGRIGHGGFLHDSVLAVPLVIRHPSSVVAGARPTILASLIDVMPTVEVALGLAPTPLPDALDLFADDLPAGRPVHAEYEPVADDIAEAVGWRLGCEYEVARRASASIHAGRYKLVWYADRPAELFDLELDPAETVDRAPAEPALAARLESALLDWRAKRARARAGGRALDPLTAETLRSLGYVQD